MYIAVALLVLVLLMHPLQDVQSWDECLLPHVYIPKSQLVVWSSMHSPPSGNPNHIDCVTIQACRTPRAVPKKQPQSPSLGTVRARTHARTHRHGLFLLYTRDSSLPGFFSLARFRQKDHHFGEISENELNLEGFNRQKSADLDFRVKRTWTPTKRILSKK